MSPLSPTFEHRRARTPADQRRTTTPQHGGATWVSTTRPRTRAEDLKGRAKEAAGSVTGDDDLKAEGRADQAESSVKQAGEKVKDAVDDIKDAFKK